MSDLKSMKEGFSQLIPNTGGLLGKETNSDKIRDEHNRWKKEIRAIKKDEIVKGKSYWQIVSSCVAL